MLTRTDSKGMSRPVDASASAGDPVSKRRRKERVQTHVKGEGRVRYFADDDKHDLKVKALKIQ